MATDINTKLITADEFMAMDLGEGRHELVRGEVVEVPPAMPEHGRICINVGFALELYARRTRVGYAIGNDSVVVTERDPDTVRGADVCFYREDRWPRAEVGTSPPPVAPDLVVEVVSPSNRPGDVSEKTREYLAAGTPLVWLVYPSKKTVVVHRSGSMDPVELGESDTLEGFAELPGFRCPVADFFL